MSIDISTSDSGCISPLATHQSTNSSRLSEVEAGELCSNRAPNKLRDKCNHTDKNDVAPGNAVVEGAKVGVEARQGKVLWRLSVSNLDRYVRWIYSRG